MRFRPLKMLLDWNRRRRERRRRAELNQVGLHAGPYRTADPSSLKHQEKHKLRRVDKKLLKAARQRIPSEVAYSLSKDARVNAKDKDGSTPLMYAAEAVCLDCVKILLKQGGDVFAKDDLGRTALDRVPKVEEGNWEEALGYNVSDANMGPFETTEWVPNPLFKEAEKIRELLQPYGRSADY